MKTARKKRDQKGKSKVLLIVIALVILAVLGGGYFLTQKAGVAIPGVKAPLNANCKHNDPELCKFLNNWQAQTSYTVTSTSSFSGMKIDSTYTMDGPDKFQMSSKMDGKENSNMITIGDTSYTLDYSDNKWWKNTYKAEEVGNDTTEDIKNNFEYNEEEDDSTYKFIVKEACGDKTCFKYELISLEDTQTKQFMWFDDRDYLIRKMRIEDAENGVSESVYDYGNVSISAPTPVKEGTPITGAGDGSGYTEEDVKKMMQQYQEPQ